MFIYGLPVSGQESDRCSVLTRINYWTKIIALPCRPSCARWIGKRLGSQHIQEIFPMVPYKLVSVATGAVFKNQVRLSFLDVSRDGPDESHQIGMTAQVRHDF